MLTIVKIKDVQKAKQDCTYLMLTEQYFQEVDFGSV